MSPVYPNPFNPRATFQLSVARDQYVRAEVVDQLGQRAAVLHDGQLSSAGTHTLAIESTGLVSGVYVVRVIGETFTAARPFVYLK